MRLRQIEVFHAIYTTGSMTAAATLLNVSQPTTDHQPTILADL